MAEQIIQMFGTQWCGDCIRAKRFLDEYQIPYQWIDIDQDQDAQSYVLQVNRGMMSVPTILFPDGSVLVEPSNTELARKLETYSSQAR